MPVMTATIGLVNSLFSTAVGATVLSDGFSTHLRQEVLSLAAAYVLEVWIGFNEWKYIVPERRFEIGTHSPSKPNCRENPLSPVGQYYIASLYH